MDNFGLIHRLSPNNVENVDKIVDKYTGWWIIFPDVRYRRGHG